MMTKIVNSLGFVEVLLNPMNAPRMYFAYIKSMGTEDKKGIEKIYSVLSDLVFASLELEVDYSEKEEAEMIKKIVRDWSSIKPSFKGIIKNMQKPVSSVSKEKSYFG